MSRQFDHLTIQPQSRGSLYELIDHVDVALECEYLDSNRADSLIQEIKTATRILNGYMKYLKGRKATKQ
ncbi:MAG: four helix bundle protein [Bacteroidota bacterium]|nr:four helix bundle protein [Bacteroidota bacterium]